MKSTLSCALRAEPHHGLAEGVRALLATAFDAVVMVTDQTSLLEAAGGLNLRLAVVNLSLARPDVGAFLQALRTECPALRVVFLSVHDETAISRSVLDAGADGFVVKRNIAAELLPAVDAALGGDTGGLTLAAS